MNPDSVRNQRFLLVRRGYDPEAVLAFLDEVADALAAAHDDDQADPGDASGAAVEVAEARRLVDEARTRAATHRLRAQRDIEALERTARARRARLVTEIEELAAARDQLSDDLDRAVDVVDRVVQWVRRTDPGAAPAPVAGLADADAAPDVGTDAAPDVGTGPAAGRAHTDTLDEDDLPADVDTSDPDPRTDAASDDQAPADETPDEDAPEVEPPDEAPGDGPEPDDGSEPAVEPPDEVDPVDDVTGEGDGTVSRDELAEDVVGDDGPPADDLLPAARAALRAVQDEVLASLRDRPRGAVEDWVPSATTLLALDDAATEATALAFVAGWEEAAEHPAGGDGDPDGSEDDADGATEAAARDALEEVRGTGALPGLGIADDLRVAIRASLGRGVDAGDAPAQLVERIAEVHRDARQTTLGPAVADALGAARHHGMLARWRHDGVAAVRWVPGEEQRCPGRRCRANATDGVVAPGEAFAWGEVVPPAHPGCTCTLAPVRDQPADA